MTKPDPEVLKLLVAVSLLASCVSASSISSNSHIRDIVGRLRANVDDFKGRIF